MREVGRGIVKEGSFPEIGIPIFIIDRFIDDYFL
jgi:hypothetical protein